MRHALKRGLLCFALTCLPIASLAGCTDEPSEPSRTAISVGALLDLSGPGKSLGQLTQAALQKAAEDAASQGSPISIVVKDTGSDPARAAQAMQELIDAGIGIVVGPQTSAEAHQILPIANAKNALVVSTGSTDSALGIANDALYRVIPTDIVESDAVFSLMKLRGRTALVTVNRADAGNQGLVDSLSSQASSAGYPVQSVGAYPTSQLNNFQDIAAQISAAVRTVSDNDPSRVGVFVAGFDEVAELLGAMSQQPDLQEVAIYAGDGSAQVQTILANSTAASYASHADALPSALITIPADKLDKASAITRAIGGTEPNPFALAAYDALLIIRDALTAESAAGQAQTTRQLFEKAAHGYRGVTGTIELDASGDRVSAPYAFWGICPKQGQEGSYAWVKVGGWIPADAASQSGTASYSGCP